MQLDNEDAQSIRQMGGNDETLKKKRRPRAKKVNKLSKEEVRQNHVSSEKKRRELVRALYDELVKIIPDLQPSEKRSEMVIYRKTINHLNWLYRINQRLRRQLEKKYRELGKYDSRIPENLIWELGTLKGVKSEEEHNGNIEYAHVNNTDTNNNNANNNTNTNNSIDCDNDKNG